MFVKSSSSCRMIRGPIRMWCAALLCLPLAFAAPQTFNDRESTYLKDFESKIFNAASSDKREEIAYLQKIFQTEILLAILKSFNETLSDIDTVAENLVIHGDKFDKQITKSRRKRTIGLLSSSSAMKTGGSASASDNGGSGSGSESGSLLNLIGPLLGSSSGGGGSGEGEGGEGGGGGGGGGSDLGSLLSLLGPLLGSSSGGGSSGGDSPDAQGNSDTAGGSGGILSLFTSLLGTSSGGGGGGNAEEGGSGGGGSDLSSILSLSSSSLGGGGGAGNSDATNAASGATQKRAASPVTAVRKPAAAPAAAAKKPAPAPLSAPAPVAAEKKSNTPKQKS